MTCTIMLMYPEINGWYDLFQMKWMIIIDCLTCSYIPSFPANFGLPTDNGTYLCLIICLILSLMETKNKIKKYIKRIGQKTGISKKSKNVQNKAREKDLKSWYLKAISACRKLNRKSGKCRVNECIWKRKWM